MKWAKRFYPPKRKRRCRQCHKWFKADKDNIWLCSDTCRKARLKVQSREYVNRQKNGVQTPKKRRCRYCGKWFTPRMYNSYTCSRECSRRYWLAAQKVYHKKRRCAACGRWYMPSHINHKYCSQPCWMVGEYYPKRRAVKQLCVDFLGGSCQVCGYNKCLAALDIHHRDPKKKCFNLRSTGEWSKRVRDELKKCILLCANCHRELHNRPRRYPSCSRGVR